MEIIKVERIQMQRYQATDRIERSHHTQKS